MPISSYNSNRAAEIVGITYRQLDYWARSNIVRPSVLDADGSGSRRRYNYSDLLELKVIKTLLDSGIGLRQVRTALEYLSTQLGKDITTANLVIDGSRSIVIKTGDDLIDLLKNGQGVLNVLSLGNVKQNLDARIIELHGEEPAYGEQPESEGQVAQGTRRAQAIAVGQ